MGVVTHHTTRAEADYRALAGFGIRTVRETAGWRSIENNGEFDFTPLRTRLDAARRCDIQIAWTLCHYGWPDDVDIFNDEWIDRFAQYCRRSAEYIGAHSATTPVFTPINEISFLAWAVCETCLIHPHRGERRDDGYRLKQRLVRAAIAGCNEVLSVFPDARFLNVDPMIHIVPPAGRPDLAAEAEHQREYQFQAWDMLGGLAAPELGGSRRYLDLVGINYYHASQWEIETNDRLHWHMNDARRMPLRDLIEEAHRRYEQPLVIAQTSHVGVGRGMWIREVAHDVAAAIAADIPVNGVCLYPVIDRPDWERPDHWHYSGLWDLQPRDQTLERVLCEPYAHQFRAAQRAVQSVLSARRGSDQFERKIPWAC